MLSKAKTPNARQVRQAETRRKLLEAARVVIAEHGLEDATTRRIAEEAGVAHGTVFLHFRDTRTLVDALLDAHLETTLARAYRTLPKRADLVGQLMHMSKCLYASYAAEPDLSKAFLSASLFFDDPSAPSQRHGREFARWAGAAIADAIANGEIEPIDPELAFLSYFSLYFGLLVAGLRGTYTPRRQLELLEASVRRLFHSKEVQP
jgi:AcrR family transcriptional regulator